MKRLTALRFAPEDGNEQEGNGSVSDLIDHLVEMLREQETSTATCATFDILPSH
ncbi:MAG: hypothetical protein AAF357_06710 [Verrucomicrobiota bacterium]